MFTAFGGEHALRGIPACEARETTDERPGRVAASQHLSTAFLRSALYRGNSDWTEAVAAVTLKPLPMSSAYMASKAAVEAFSEGLALEVESFGVRVRLVIPGRARNLVQRDRLCPFANGVPEAYAA